MQKIVELTLSLLHTKKYFERILETRSKACALSASFSLLATLLTLCPLLSSCAVTAVRPAQEMSNMEVALRASKEVNADVLAPELYRLAVESGIQARRDYRFKNFEAAKKNADRARTYAERAEFESIRNGGKRDILPEDPLSQPSYPAEPTGSPNPDSKTKGKNGAPPPPSAPGGDAP